MDSLGQSTSDEEPGLIKKFFLVPCMKKSVMYAISGGTGVFLAQFLFTSNLAKSGKYGSIAYFSLLFGTWGVCRYQHGKKIIAERKWQQSIQDQSGESNYKRIDPKDV